MNTTEEKDKEGKERRSEGRESRYKKEGEKQGEGNANELGEL